MDDTTPLRQSGEFSIPPPSNETSDNTQTNSIDEAQTPSASAESTLSPSLGLLDKLPRELRDMIYEHTYTGLVVLGRRGLLPADREGPSYPETTSQVATKYGRVIYPGNHPSFGAEDADDFSESASQTAGNNDDDQQVNPPQHAELSAYGASVRKSLRAYDPAAVSTSDAANDEAIVKPSMFKRCISRILLAACCGALSRKLSRNDDSPATSSNEEANEHANEETVVIRSSASKTSGSGLLRAS